MTNGVNIDRFNYHKKRSNDDIVNVRRKKLKLSNSGGISVPTEPCMEQTLKELYNDITNGKYEIGEQVAAIKFKKSSSIDGKLVWDEFTLEGRKNPLHVIRKKLYENHKDYYRIKSDSEVDLMSKEDCKNYLQYINEYKVTLDEANESSLQEKVKYFQRRRHLSVWHDCSSISNHEHILFTCTEMYDKAIHLSDDEAFKKFGRNIDVQNLIEEPVLYMIGRCHGDSPITTFTETRIEDIKKLSQPLDVDGIKRFVVVSFFK